MTQGVLLYPYLIPVERWPRRLVRSEAGGAWRDWRGGAAWECPLQAMAAARRRGEGAVVDRRAAPSRCHPQVLGGEGGGRIHEVILLDPAGTGARDRDGRVWCRRRRREE